MYLLGVQWNMDFIQRWFFMFQKIAKECLAGFTVAIVALPLAIAFGIAAQERLRERLLDCMVRFLQVYSQRYLADTWASNRANWTNYRYCNRSYCDARVRGKFYCLYDGRVISNFIRCM